MAKTRIYLAAWISPFQPAKP